VSKTYQHSKIDTPDALELTVPEHLNVVMAEVAADMREGLLALAVGAGLQVMTAMMDADVNALAGPRGKHNVERVAVRHGTERGSVTLGGRRVPAQRPRVRATDGSGELPVPAYECSAAPRCGAGWRWRRCWLACRAAATVRSGWSRSVSRSPPRPGARRSRRCRARFVAQTETALAELLSADLSQLDLVALMVDGVHFPETCCVVALGIDLQGNKIPLALVEGATENATLVTELLVGLRERGLDVTRPILACLDGAKALRRSAGRVRQAGDPTLPTPQDPQRTR
jgi:putative transposase